MFWNLGLKGLLVHSVGKVAQCLMNCHFGIPLAIARGTKPAAPNGALHLHRQWWKVPEHRAAEQDRGRQMSSGRSKEGLLTLQRSWAHGEGRGLESDRKVPFLITTIKERMRKWELWLSGSCVTKTISPHKVTVQAAAFWQVGSAV